MTPPAPLTPPDCDLRDFPSMLLDVVRLRDSETAAIPDAEGFRAAVLLWCASWHQVPAASLPDDDAALCRLAGYGRDARTWGRARKAGAMRGWVKCSDGRLYHPVVAEKAVEAIKAKAKQRQRTEAARQAKQQKTNGVSDATTTETATTSVTEPATEPVTDTVATPVTASKVREGKVIEGRVPTSSGAEAPPGDPRTVLWAEGLATLQRLIGLPVSKARTRLGQLLRDAGDDCPGLLRVLRECPQTGDPNSWLTRAAGALAKPREPPSKLGWMIAATPDDGITIDAEPENLRLVQ